MPRRRKITAPSKEEESKVEEEEVKKAESSVEKTNVVVSTVKEQASRPPRPSEPHTVTRVGAKGDLISVGIDLGTYQTTFSASNGVRDHLLSIMGWPKDPVSRKFIGKDVVFGDEVLKRRLALDTYHPVEDLMFNPDEVDTDALADFLQELKNRVTGGKEGKIQALICIPSKVPKNYIARLEEACENVFETTSFIAVPFANAIALDLMHTLIVNVGASSINMGRIYGSIPTEEDLLTIEIGSRSIDEELVNYIIKDYPKAQVTTEMARIWKEQYSFIGRSNEKVIVTMPVEGIPTNIDITEYMEAACTIIVDDIANGIRQLIATFDPEFQDLIRGNIIFTGNGSQIKGLSEAINEKVRDMRCTLRSIKDPMYIGADGALRILQEVPELIGK